MSRRDLIKLGLVLSVSINVAALGALTFHWLRRGCATCNERPVPGAAPASLNLSPEQEARFGELRSDFRAYRERCHKEMEGLREALLGELLSESPRQARIEALLDRMGTRQAALQRRLTEHLLAEKATLEPGQLAAFEHVIRRHVLGPRTGTLNCTGSATQGAR